MIKLYSSATSADSHRTRIVLAEKELPGEVIDVDPEHVPEALLERNLSGKLPTIEDRDTVLFEASVVNEYLDERYPHPPLKPGSPAERAQMRLAVLRIEQELYPLFENFDATGGKGDSKAKLEEYLEAIDTHLSRQPYFVGECYTLADITMAPILWRLKSKMDMGKWTHLEGYMDRLFERPAFERALSEHEQMLNQY